MNNIATQRIKREFKEVIKSEEVIIIYLSVIFIYSYIFSLSKKEIFFKNYLLFLFKNIYLNNKYNLYL